MEECSIGGYSIGCCPIRSCPIGGYFIGGCSHRRWGGGDYCGRVANTRAKLVRVKNETTEALVSCHLGLHTTALEAAQLGIIRERNISGRYCYRFDDIAILQSRRR